MSLIATRKWQDKKRLENKCIGCGKRKIFKGSLCRLHYAKAREYQLEYQRNDKDAQKIRMAKWRKENPNYYREYYQRLKNGIKKG